MRFDSKAFKGLENESFVNCLSMFFFEGMEGCGDFLNVSFLRFLNLQRKEKVVFAGMTSLVLKLSMYSFIKQFSWNL